MLYRLAQAKQKELYLLLGKHVLLQKESLLLEKE